MDLRTLCRICFEDNNAVDVTAQKFNVMSLVADTEEALTIQDILQSIHGDSQLLSMDLIDELPMICNACVEECLLHYAYVRKLTTANRQLRQFYNEAQLTQFEEQSVKKEPDINADEQPIAGEIVEHMDETYLVLTDVDEAVDISNARIKVSSEDSLIVSEFLAPTQVNDHEVKNTSQFPSVELRTMSFAAVELKHNNLEELNKASTQLIEGADSQTIYKCQYCQCAYSNQEFLKAHLLKVHVCKHCTACFVKSTDLHAHIRERHTQHTCAVCGHHFSTGSNLRTHLKRVHNVQLPAKVSLLEYRPANEEKYK